MATELHIIVHPDNPVIASVVQIPPERPASEVVVVDLTAGAPDYGKLLDEIFAAQSISVW
jgi:hypothetical protein